MEMRRGKKRRSLILNITSLIDVMFLLLIFFMISTTFLSAPAIKLELPEAEHSENVRQTPLVVHIDQSGRVFLNDEPIELALLGEALKVRIANDVEKAVVLKIDSRVSHGHVIEVLDIIRGSGIRKISFSTRPED
jgi:biopolymer transport protein ExbD